jgi:hypothetical protein
MTSAAYWRVTSPSTGAAWASVNGWSRSSGLMDTRARVSGGIGLAPPDSMTTQNWPPAVRSSVASGSVHSDTW